MKRVLSVACGVVLCAALFSGCGKKQAAVQEEKKPLVTVMTKKIAAKDMEAYIDFSGTVKALDTVTIYPTVSGKIVRWLVEEGDKVSKNQVIAQVDPSKPGAEFALNAVRASVAGTVTQIVQSIGSYVTSSSAIAEISSADKLELTIQVSEKFVPFIAKGATAAVSFKAYPDEAFSARVTKISPVLNAATRTMATALTIDDAKGIVKAGMFAHVRLLTQKKEGVLCVSEEAIIHSGKKQYVFVAENGVVSRREIETGLSVDGEAEVIEGLRKGDEVVVSGQNMLSDGQAVRVAASE